MTTGLGRPVKGQGRWWLVAFLLVLFSAPQAFARPEPVRTPGAETSPGSHLSYSLWTIDGTGVRLRFMVPAAEAQALVGPGKPVLRTAEVSDAVSQALSVTSSSGDCPAVDQGEDVGEIYTMAVTPGLDRFEVLYACSDASGIVLHDKFLFDKDRTHINLARVQVGSQPARLTQFTADQQAIAAPAKSPGLRAYADDGARRFLRRPQALAFVAVMLLLALGWRELGWTLGGLVVGYGLSLAVTAAGFIMTRPSLSGTGIALLIVGAAAAGLRRRQEEASPRAWHIVAVVAALVLAVAAGLAAWRVGNQSVLVCAGLAVVGLALVWDAGASARPVWLVVTPALLFGLLDGLGPASDVSVLNLPRKAILPALAGMDVGAAAVEVGLTGVVAGLLWLLRGRLAGLRKAASDVTGAALIGLGVFWFVSQLYSW